jgi:hypothetical protein
MPVHRSALDILGSFAVVCLVILALAVPARANEHEVVFAVRRTELHIRAGEASPVVGHADEGDELEVLGDRGRWLRVRNGKQIGWLTGTETSPTKPAEPRRSQRSGFSGKATADALKVTIAIDRVRGFDDPNSKANNVLDLRRGEVVTVIGWGHRGWILVEQDNGEVGWIPAAAASDANKFAGDPRRAPAKTAEASAAPPAASAAAPAAAATVVVPVEPAEPTGRALFATLLATGGLQTFQMEQSGEGEATADATGGLVTIAALAQMRVLGAIWAGVGATAELGTASLTYHGATDSQPMSTRELGVDGYGEIGWGGPRYVALRGGVHYAKLSVSSDRTEPMLLGERIGGPTVGLAGGLPVWRSVTFSAAFDVMPAGNQRLSRTPPGTLYATGVRAMWAHAGLAMPLPAHLLAALSYRFGLLSADLTDGAAMPKTATRSDQSHVITGGVGMAW